MFPFLKSRHSPAAVEPSLPAIEPIGGDMDLAPFSSRDPRDIATTLQALVADGDLVSLYPAEGGACLPGRIAEVLVQAGQLVVEARGARPPQPGPVLLVSMPQGIKIQFRVSGSWQGRPGAPLYLTAGLPDEIIHLQRRRFPRVEAPLGLPMRVEFVLQGETFVLSVDDLSMGGLGLRSSAREGSGLMPGQQLRRVRLELGQGSPLAVDLEIRSRRAFRSFLAGEQLHLGCRFIDPAPAIGEELQRILARLDAERSRQWRAREQRSG
jgi:c-di-GMP-binding flagellar brake protein YcgR